MPGYTWWVDPHKKENKKIPQNNIEAVLFEIPYFIEVEHRDGIIIFRYEEFIVGAYKSYKGDLLLDQKITRERIKQEIVWECEFRVNRLKENHIKENEELRQKMFKKLDDLEKECEEKIREIKEKFLINRIKNFPFKIASFICNFANKRSIRGS